MDYNLIALYVLQAEKTINQIDNYEELQTVENGLKEILAMIENRMYKLRQRELNGKGE